VVNHGLSFQPKMPLKLKASIMPNHGLRYR